MVTVTVAAVASESLDEAPEPVYTQPMLGFLIKKSFFDLWDNMFRVALINLGFIASAAVPVFLPGLFETMPILQAVTLFAGLLWCFIYLSAASLTLKNIADYQSFGFAEFGANLRVAWPAGLVLGGCAFLVIIMLTTVIPFYAQINSMLGMFMASIVFWVLVAAVLSLQFFLAIRGRLDQKLTKAFRKSFVIFIDNPGFCVFTLVSAAIQLVLSVFLAFLFPGPAGVLLFFDEALRLRLLKYDWLELNPEANRRKIPWDALLIDEREKTGTRSLRNFIFPWKD
jgi:hypothetical protein